MISKISVKKAYTVLVGVVLVIVLGVVSFTRMTTDLLPNISLPYVVVMTTYVGASPETVETVVTQPVEASMATVSNIESISSVSSENYSMVILEFAQSTNMDSVSLEIRENLDQISSYWDDEVGSPIIMKLNPDMLPVMIAAVGVEGMEAGEISSYVEDNVAPELESLEGVASVSATGLLEESVNVVINQDKIDALNTLIYAAIDEQMLEAEQELVDARQKIIDSRREMANGRQELANGQAELDQGKAELENGKTELAEQQDSMTTQLAETKSTLLTAKADLEAAKITMSTNLTTAQTLNGTLREIDLIMGAAGSYRTASRNLQKNLPAAEVSGGDVSGGNVSGGDVSGGNGGTGGSGNGSGSGSSTSGNSGHAGNGTGSSGNSGTGGSGNGSGSGTGKGNPEEAERYRKEINSLKKSVMNSTIMQQVDGVSAELDPLLKKLNDLDWSDPKNIKEVQSSLDRLALLTTAPLLIQRIKMEAAINSLTNSLGVDAYVPIVNQTVASLDEQLALVNQGLTEVEKGELTAAIEFANLATQMTLGDMQLQMGQSQLDSALEQLNSGESQLDEAEKQIDDGEEQLEDARESAYESADMTEIVTADMVSGLLTAQNFSMPAGYVTENGIDYLVRIGDKPTTAEELRELPLLDLHMDNVPLITLDSVADVFETDNSDEVYANVNGSAGVMLTIQKQTGYSTGEVSDRLLERFDQMMEEDSGLSLIVLMDQGVYIDLVMDSILNNILFGGFLAILILILFLKDLRPTLVVAVSIPISLVTAIVCMYFSNVTLNVISLSGLALGIGMLVDNSIVVIENIYRMRGEGMGIQEAAIEGAREVGGAIMASTLTTICVFLPIVFTEGITRQLFVDMGLTIAYSLLASLLIALTVVPAMSSRILTKSKEQREGRFFRGLVAAYSKLLSVSLKVKPLVLLLVVALLAGSVVAAFSKGTAFMPSMDSTQLTVSVQMKEGTPLKETAAVTDQVVERILELDEIQDVGAMTSGSTASLLVGAGGGGDTTSTSIYVTTKEDKTTTNEVLADLILEQTADLDAEITVDTSTMDMSALGGSGISIRVMGRELDMIRQIASEVAAIVEEVEGTTEVSDGLEEADEELRIVIDKEEAIKYGLTVAQVFSQIYGKLAEATSATTLVSADKDYNVYVRNGNDMELTRRLVRGLEIEGTDESGAAVKLKLEDIADFQTTLALSSINRADQNRYVAVSAAIADGYNVGQVSTRVEERLRDYPLPSGYRLVFSGENETINDAMEQVTLMLVLALVFMYLIMVAQFQSLLSPFIIMFTIPLAFTGGFLGLYISGSEVSVIAMIGFVMLSGIIVNNGIVLIDYMNQLRENGMEKRQAILTAGRTRLRPVLMTALTTILALSTMVFSHDMGSEMAKPMAIVTIGGLSYGTLLTLIVIPCIYDYFIREKREKGNGKNRRIRKSRRAAGESQTTV